MMLTNVRDTSISTYRSIQDEGCTGRQHRLIMAAIKPGRDYSLRELSVLTDVAINAVSGRVNELKESGALVEGRKRRCAISGRTIRPVRLPQKQLAIEF
jgi:hypothetical protein